MLEMEDKDEEEERFYRTTLLLWELHFLVDSSDLIPINAFWSSMEHHVLVMSSELACTYCSNRIQALAHRFPINVVFSKPTQYLPQLIIVLR